MNGNQTYFNDMHNKIGKKKERTEEGSVKYQIQVPSVFPSIDPDQQSHHNHIKTMNNFYSSNLHPSEINQSLDQNKGK